MFSGAHLANCTHPKDLRVPLSTQQMVAVWKRIAKRLKVRTVDGVGASKLDTWLLVFTIADISVVVTMRFDEIRYTTIDNKLQTVGGNFWMRYIGCLVPRSKSANSR